MTLARARSVEDAESHKQSLSPLCTVKTNGRWGRYGMAAVILMGGQTMWNTVRAYSLMREKVVFANSIGARAARLLMVVMVDGLGSPAMIRAQGRSLAMNRAT